jgi:diguanylate cyclase (GGDEF)-like protein
MPHLPNVNTEPFLPLLHHAFEGVALAVPEPWRLVYVNPTLARWLNRGAEELRGTLLETMFSAASRAELFEHADKVWGGTATRAALTASMPDDTDVLNPIHVRLCRVAVADEDVLGVIVRSGTEVSHSVTIERRDPLTGLPDRAFLLTRLATLLQGDRCRDREFAILFIDLDNFKQINDAYGHLLGDRVLCEVAARLSGCVREGDHVTRFGGDEFVVLLEHVTGREEMHPVVERIHRALEEPIVLPDGPFTLSLSIGVAQAGPHHGSPEDVLREADREMYAAKRARP